MYDPDARSLACALPRRRFVVPSRLPAAMTVTRKSSAPDARLVMAGRRTPLRLHVTYTTSLHTEHGNHTYENPTYVTLRMKVSV
jgi:hypothetical protein